MSKSWPMVALGEVLTHFQEYINAPEARMYPKLSVKLYGKGVVLDAPTDGATLKMKRHQLAKVGQVILSEIWGKKGAIGFVPPEGDGALCTSHFFLFDVRHDILEPKWLKALFAANYLQEQLDAEAKGTTGYAAVRPKNLLAAIIPLPPLSEQQRIVARIEELAAKIEEASNLRQQTTEEAEAYIISLHMNLSGSRTKKLGDILSLDEDSVPIIPTSSYPQVGVRGFGGGLFAKPATSGMDTTYRVFNRLYEGALVMSQVKAWEGAVAVCENNLAGFFVSPEYRTFRFEPSEAIPSYFAAIVKTEWFWSRLKNATRGVGARRERTRPEQFLNIEIPVPNVAQQKEAAIILDKIESIKRLHAETAAELDAMLPSILDKAFKGDFERISQVD